MNWRGVVGEQFSQVGNSQCDGHEEGRLVGQIVNGP